MNIDEFVAFKKATADSALVSTYRNERGEVFEMVHPNAEHKRLVDLKHRLRGTLVS